MPHVDWRSLRATVLWILIKGGSKHSSLPTQSVSWYKRKVLIQISVQALSIIIIMAQVFAKQDTSNQQEEMSVPANR